MSGSRKPGSSERPAQAAAVDPQAPTQTSLRPDARPARAADKRAPGAFTPDAPTKIMPPSNSLEESLRAYNTAAATQATNLRGMLDDDPFASRATDVAFPSFSSEEAEAEAEADGAPLADLDDLARVDLRPPARRAPAAELDVAGEPDDVVEISLSDMDAVSDADRLPEMADDDSDEDTHDTVVNLPLPASLQADAKEPPPARAPPPLGRRPTPGPTATKTAAKVAPKPPLPMATVIERRSHSPAALFDDDTASVTDPRAPAGASDAPLDGAAAPRAPDVAPPRALASERTAARPSLASHPSGAPSHNAAAEEPPALADAPAPVPEAAEVAAPLDADDDGDADDDEVVDATIAPELSDVSDDELPPLLHRWKVVPTAIRALERAPPAAPAGFGAGEQTKSLQTVLWSPDDEAAARAEHASQRARNPFWAPTDVGIDEPESLLESTEAAAPSEPHHAAAAYIHDAVAYLRSLSSFGAHLDDDVRRDFDSRLLGANEKLRRALTVLHSAFGADNPTLPAEEHGDEPAVGDAHDDDDEA